MSEIEDVLARAANAVDEEFERTQRPRLARMHGQVVRRARRRRFTKTASATVLAVGGAVVLSAVPIAMPFDRPAPSQGPAIVPAGGPNESTTEGLGLWPYPTEARSADLCESLLGNQHAVAAQFVGDVLGWSNSGERNIKHVDDDTLIKEQGNFPSTFAGGPAPEEPWITLELSRIGNGKCWWVTGLSDPENGASFSVTVRDGDLDATWTMPDGAERADLIVVDSDSPAREFVAGEPGATQASVDTFAGPGYAVVLWKNVEGTAFSAAGVTLPEGDYSATSP